MPAMPDSFDADGLARQLGDATDLHLLALAAARITPLIARLHQGGTPVGLMAQQVQALNALLIQRAWHLLAPAGLVANSCLFVMGSEGRGEQLLKTDQDNGLILRDGYSPPADLAAICQRFSQALADFGYPPCPGHIMLSNPAWRHSAAEFGQTVRRWLLLPSADSLLALAIFIDARAVCGDAALLAQVRSEVQAGVVESDALLARFASAIHNFDHEGGAGWWLHLFAADAGRRPLDLKKAGIFPLVHGVRALALAEHLACTGTTERIQALVAAQRLPAELGRALADSLHLFMRLKLDIGLAAVQAGKGGGGQSGQSGALLRPAQLSSADRDALKHALAVVKRFKLLLLLRFHLDAL